MLGYVKGLRKIVITGPESSGKTTLARELARELKTNWVPEQARTYLDGLQRPYELDDLVVIAELQVRAEEEAIRQTSGVLICDTDLLTIHIWAQVRYGHTPKYILGQIEKRQYELYLLCRPDIPWEPDPLREHPGLRDELFHLYKDELTRFGKAFRVIAGSPEDRLDEALRQIRKIE